MRRRVRDSLPVGVTAGADALKCCGRPLRVQASEEEDVPWFFRLPVCRDLASMHDGQWVSGSPELKAS
jgi:hypothetical protein